MEETKEDKNIKVTLYARDTETGKYKTTSFMNTDLPPGLAKNFTKNGDFRPNKNALKHKIADLFNVEPSQVTIPKHIKATGKIEEDED